MEHSSESLAFRNWQGGEIDAQILTNLTIEFICELTKLDIISIYFD